EERHARCVQDERLHGQREGRAVRRSLRQGRRRRVGEERSAQRLDRVQRQGPDDDDDGAGPWQGVGRWGGFHEGRLVDLVWKDRSALDGRPVDLWLAEELTQSPPAPGWGITGPMQPWQQAAVGAACLIASHYLLLRAAAGRIGDSLGALV